MSKPNLLITGASSGMGWSLLSHFKDKFQIHAVARRADKILEHFKNEVIVYKCDLSQPNEVADLAAKITGTIRPSYAILNAGIMTKSMITDLSTETLMNAIQVNALSNLTLLQACLSGMKAKGFGRVAVVTSGAVFNCSPGFGAYSASKSLLNALMITAAKEHADHDIRINLVSPGPVRSEMAPQATLDPSVAHSTFEYALSVPQGGPTGRFFWLNHEVPLVPDFGGTDWLNAKPGTTLKPLNPTNSGVN